MPFERPTLTELTARADADMAGRLKGGDAVLRRSIERGLARIHAGAMHGLYGALDYASRQMLPDTADDEHLLRHAGGVGVELKAGVKAAGAVDVTGSDTSPIPAGTRLQRDDEVEFVTTADAVIAAGVAAVPIEAALAGTAGNAIAGVELTFVSPVPGVASLALVAMGGLTGGTEQEDLEDLRRRVQARRREQPAGGNRGDYKRWAREVPGVTRAWVTPNRDGLGTVGVTFVMDGREDILPLGGDLTTVADYIENLRPVTADVTVFACTPLALDPEITINPDTPAVRAAVEAELRDLIAREAEPGSTLLLSHIREAISAAAGEIDHVLISPVANVVAGAEELIVLGTIDWS